MDLKREEQLKKNYSKKSNFIKNKIEEIDRKFEKYQGVILFLLFIIVLASIPGSSERFASYILMLEKETISEFIKTVLIIITIFAELIMITNNIRNKRKEKEDVRSS